MFGRRPPSSRFDSPMFDGPPGRSMGMPRSSRFMESDEDAIDASHVEGTAEAEKKVFDWLEKQIGKSQETEGDLEITLGHKGPNTEDTFDAFEYELGKNLQELASDIVVTARTNALEYRGRTRYIVRVEDRPKPCLFTLATQIPESRSGDDFGTDELPNQQGLMALLMNHSAISFREMHHMSRGLREDVFREKRILAEREDIVRHREIEMIKLFEELVSGKDRRELARQEFVKQEERKDKGVETLQAIMKMIGMQYGIVPPQALAAAAAGAPLPPAAVPANVTPMEQELFAVMAALEQNPDKAIQIAQILGDEKAIASIMKLQKLAAEKRQEAVQNAPATDMFSGK